MRLKLALPFTVLAEPGVVRLVAGEDHRYELAAPGLDAWLPDVLRKLDGRPVDAALADVPSEKKEPARALLERLRGERVLVDALALDAHAPTKLALLPRGSGPVFETLSRSSSEEERDGLVVLCQDRLDLEEALREGKRARQEKRPWLWATTGALARGWVSPVFLPDAGPCVACLVAHQERLSPAPQVLRGLREHARAGGRIEPVPFPAPGAAILASLVLWKSELLRETDPSPALYKLHVLEVATLEVSSHRVLRDPFCEACA